MRSLFMSSVVLSSGSPNWRSLGANNKPQTMAALSVLVSVDKQLGKSARNEAIKEESSAVSEEHTHSLLIAIGDCHHLLAALVLMRDNFCPFLCSLLPIEVKYK